MSGLTVAQRLWLTKLATDGPTKRAKNRVGYDCMQAGWTEWNYTFEGEPISDAEAKSRLGDLWFEQVEMDWRDRITPAGRAALNPAREECGKR